MSHDGEDGTRACSTNAPPTDEQLASSAVNGHGVAFERLLERYQERLMRFLLARCRSRADAEDVLQETFISAFRYLPSYNPRWRFSTWLYRIAIRKAQNISMQTVPREEPREVAATSPDPLEACLLASERENLWLLAKRRLSADSFTVLWLRYAEDLPVKEVARILGRPQSWTKVVLLRARRKLGRELEERPVIGKEGRLYEQS